jgi:hypothetical protein
MAKTFGTLRRDSYFTPSEILTEAEALNSAIKLLGRARFESGLKFDATAMAAWNSYVLNWKKFYNRITATLTGWVVRSENSTRDNLLNFEDDYNVFLGATEVSAPGSTTVIPAPKADTSRTEDSIKHAVEEAASTAKEAAKGLAVPLATVLGVVVAGGIAYTLWKGRKHHG